MVGLGNPYEDDGTGVLHFGDDAPALADDGGMGAAALTSAPPDPAQRDLRHNAGRAFVNWFARTMNLQWRLYPDLQCYVGYLQEAELFCVKPSV